MSILLDNTTRVIVQGITGREGQYHTSRMIAAGTNVVGGVTPGKGGQTVEGLPVFDTVFEAKAATDANASCIFVPPPGAADAIMEAAAAGIQLIVCITEGIPVVDMTRAILMVREQRSSDQTVPDSARPDTARSASFHIRSSRPVPSASSRAPAHSPTKSSHCSRRPGSDSPPASASGEIPSSAPLSATT
jgi:hypothetical protein